MRCMVNICIYIYIYRLNDSIRPPGWVFPSYFVPNTDFPRYFQTQTWQTTKNTPEVVCMRQQAHCSYSGCKRTLLHYVCANSCCVCRVSCRRRFAGSACDDKMNADTVGRGETWLESDLTFLCFLFFFFRWKTLRGLKGGRGGMRRGSCLCLLVHPWTRCTHELSE